MTNSKTEPKAGSRTAPEQTSTVDERMRAFEQKLDADDFAGAQRELEMARGAEEAGQAQRIKLLLAEIEGRLENGEIAQAKKCQELMMRYAPERRAEADMWFADYYLDELRRCLATSGIASYGQALKKFLEHAPQREEEADQLIAQYYMNRLKRAMAEGRGEVAEMKALGELLRYGPQRRDEAYQLFAQRAMGELEQALEDHDKEYTRIAMEEFIRYAPHRKAEAEAVVERHRQAAQRRKLYEILGVERTASAEQIRTAYRALARRLHPDLNQNDPQVAEQMGHVNAAYSILSDPELRARYDQRGDRREN